MELHIGPPQIKLFDGMEGFGTLEVYRDEGFSFLIEGLKCMLTYELWSKLFKGWYIGDHIGFLLSGLLRGDTRSLDFSSHTEYRDNGVP